MAQSRLQTRFHLVPLHGYLLLLGKEWLYNIGAKIDVRGGLVLLRHCSLKCNFSPPDKNVGFASLVCAVRIPPRSHVASGDWQSLLW